jgi:hypothetical protein
MISIILFNIYDLYHIVFGGKEANIVRLAVRSTAQV